MYSDAPSTTFLPYAQHLFTMSSQQARLSGFSNDNSAHLEAEERWKEALERYREETGHDLLAYTFARDILSQSSTDAVMAQFTKFKEFRSSGGKILRVLKPIVSVVINFIDAGAEAGSVRTSPLSHSNFHSSVLPDRKLPLAERLSSLPLEHCYR